MVKVAGRAREEGRQVGGSGDSLEGLDCEAEEDIGFYNDHDHQIMSENELQRCHKIRDHYLCGQHRMFLKGLKTSCLGSIYAHEFGSAANRCNLHQSTAIEEAFQTGNGEFRIMIPNPLLAQMRCKEDRIDSILHIHGSYDVDIPEGCRLDLGRLSIRRSPVQGLHESFHLRIVNQAELNVIWSQVSQLNNDDFGMVSYGSNMNNSVEWFDDSKYGLLASENNSIRDTLIIIIISFISTGIIVGLCYYIIRPRGWLMGRCKWLFHRHLNNKIKKRKIDENRFGIEMSLMVPQNQAVKGKPPSKPLVPTRSSNRKKLTNPVPKPEIINVDEASPQSQLASVLVNVVNDVLATHASQREVV